MTKYMKKQLKDRPELSIIIVSFNTKDLLQDCLNSLKKVKKEIPFEIIVSDNASKDGSVEFVKELSKKDKSIKLIENKKNLGFARGNNIARKIARGEYVLFLNSDTKVHSKTLREAVEYLKAHKEVGSLTCKILLPDGSLDLDARRRFPTPLISFKRIFLGKYKDYWYLDRSADEIHEVDVIQGAFHLTRRKILNEVGWFDKDYFLDGEDVDLCWKIKQAGYKIVYYPVVSITHVKKASKKRLRSSFAVTSGVRAMEIFYKKHLWERYPFFINYLVLFGVRFLLIMRLVKFNIQMYSYKFTSGVERCKAGVNK